MNVVEEALLAAFDLIDNPLNTPAFIRDQIAVVEKQYGAESFPARAYRRQQEQVIARAEKRAETYLKVKEVVEAIRERAGA